MFSHFYQLFPTFSEVFHFFQLSYFFSLKLLPSLACSCKVLPTYDDRKKYSFIQPQQTANNLYKMSDYREYLITNKIEQQVTNLN